MCERVENVWICPVSGPRHSGSIGHCQEIDVVGSHTDLRRYSHTDIAANSLDHTRTVASLAISGDKRDVPYFTFTLELK